MCGIVAMISTNRGGFLGNDLDIFEQMLYVDALRGPDSTGAFCVLSNTQVTGFKHAAPPNLTFTTQGYQQFRRDAVQTGRVLVGHNRKATHGDVNNANSHPFYEGHIVLVHNGMLFDHKNQLADRDVDSHAFAAALSETDPKSVPQLIADTNGAFAFVWWDMEQKKLFFTRNSQRPLNVIRYNERIVLASETWMAAGAIQRNEKGLSADDKNPKHFRYYEVEPNKLWSYDLDGQLSCVEIPAKKAVVTTGQVPAVVTPKEAHRGTTTGTANGQTGPTAEPRIQQQAHPYFNQLPKPRNTHEKRVAEVGGTFRVGNEVVFKITKAQEIGSGASRRFRAMGVVAQLGKPGWDVASFLPKGTDIGDVSDWLNEIVIGEISTIHPDLAAGPSILVKDIRKPMKGELQKSHNGVFLLSPEWEWIDTNCKCKFCQAKIMPYEHEATNVKINKDESVEVVCADCVEQRIDNEEVKADFVKRRIAALDSWQPISQESKLGTQQSIAGPGSSTVQ